MYRYASHPLRQLRHTVGWVRAFGVINGLCAIGAAQFRPPGRGHDIGFFASDRSRHATRSTGRRTRAISLGTSRSSSPVSVGRTGRAALDHPTQAHRGRADPDDRCPGPRRPADGVRTRRRRDLRACQHARQGAAAAEHTRACGPDRADRRGRTGREHGPTGSAHDRRRAREHRRRLDRIPQRAEQRRCLPGPGSALEDPDRGERTGPAAGSAGLRRRSHRGPDDRDGGLHRSRAEPDDDHRRARHPAFEQRDQPAGRRTPVIGRCAGGGLTAAGAHLRGGLERRAA